MSSSGSTRPRTETWGIRLLSPNGPEYANFRRFKLLTDRDLIALGIPNDLLNEHAMSITDYVSGVVVAEHNERMLHTLLETHIRMLPRDNSNALIVLLEPVPDVNFVLAGYRVWWFTNIHEEAEPGDVIQFGIMQDNVDRKREQESSYYAKTQRVSSHAKHFKFHDMDMDAYLLSCQLLVPGQLYAGREEVRNNILSSRHNPANPRYVFGINNAMTSIPKAHPDWCKIENYMERVFGDGNETRLYKFPSHPNFDYKIVRLTPQQATPKEFCSVYAPHIRATNDTTHWRDQIIFHEAMHLRGRLQQNSEDVDEDEDEEMKDDRTVILSYNPYDTPLSHPQAFDFAVASQTKTDLQWRPEKLRASNEARREKIDQGRLQRLQQGQSIEQVNKWASEQRHANFKQGLNEFIIAVWNENANISEELKIVIRWGQHYLTEHPNFHCDRPKMTKNLPTSTEWLVSLTFYAEFWLFLYFHHEYLGLLLLQQFNAYDMERTGVRLHYLGTGPPGTGKSVLLNWASRLFIPDTVVSVTYETLKAKMSVPKLPNGERTIDNSISQCHERSNEEMGIGLTNNKSGASAEKNNMKKDWLDSGRAACKRSRKDGDTGEWVMDTIFIKCVGTEAGNTNYPAHSIERAYRDRVCIAPFSANPQRSDNKFLADVQSITQTASMERMRESLQRDIRCKQYLRALIGYLEYVGLMPRVHTKASTEIISKVMKRARKAYGLRKDVQARTTAKLTKICSEMAIQTGLYHMFSAETSPLRKKRWEISDIEGMQYWMHSTVGHGVLALGMLKDSELEDKSQHRLIQAMQKLWFTETTVAVEEKTAPADSKDAKQDFKSDVDRRRAALATFFHRSQTLEGIPDPLSNQPQSVNNSQIVLKTQSGEVDPNYLYAPDVFTPRQRRTPQQRTEAPKSDGKDEKMPDAARGPSTRERLFFGNREEKFEFLATLLRAQFDEGPKPDLSEIVAILKDMIKDSTVTDDNREIPTLQFCEDGILLATNAVLKNHPRPIEQAIIDVLQHRRTKETRYPFTCGWEGKPYLFRCVDVKPNPDKKFKVTNPTYADEQQRKVLRNLAPLDEQGKPMIDLNEIYATTATTVLGEDLEEKELRTHLFSIHWCDDDVRKWQFAPERAMDEKYVEAAEKRLGEALPIYPDEICAKTKPQSAKKNQPSVPMDVDDGVDVSSSSSSSPPSLSKKRKADAAGLSETPLVED